MDVLFVCLGNICRSPMAEGILKQIYKQRSIQGNVESVGLMDWNADKARRLSSRSNFSRKWT